MVERYIFGGVSPSDGPATCDVSTLRKAKNLGLGYDAGLVPSAGVVLIFGWEVAPSTKSLVVSDLGRSPTRSPRQTNRKIEQVQTARVC